MYRIFSLRTSPDGGVDLVVVSLQCQPVLSLAHKFGIGVQEAAEKVSAFFRSLGADCILDTRAAEDLALQEHRVEFLARKREEGGFRFPLLTSSCPGWICYAEKTHGSWILPHVSRVRSAQQIMGAFVKDALAARLGVAPGRVRHVTLMPCFDKKLEASRADFVDAATGTRDVDLVMTTVELEQMMEEKEVGLSSLQSSPLDDLFGREEEEAYRNVIVRGNAGSGSGGYAEEVFVHAARELYGETPTIRYRTMRNADFKELVYERDGKVVLKFAVANGFRNIQNIVQKMKRKRFDYDFVEVMACPGGCLNGGAQSRPPDGSITSREVVAALEEAFQGLERRDPEDNGTTRRLYEEWLGGKQSDKAASLLYTDYHEVEKMASSLAIKW